MKTIPLNHGKAVIVDDDDFDYLSQYNWFLQSTKRPYVQRHDDEQRRGKIYMHRQILGCLPEMEVDHINGDCLDNRKCNLRMATHSQNMVNQSKRKRNSCSYKGICLNRNKTKWRAQISINGRTNYLGTFCSEEEAALAYNHAAEKQYGSFARLNKIKDEKDALMRLARLNSTGKEARRATA